MLLRATDIVVHSLLRRFYLSGHSLKFHPQAYKYGLINMQFYGKLPLSSFH